MELFCYLFQRKLEKIKEDAVKTNMDIDLNKKFDSFDDKSKVIEKFNTTDVNCSENFLYLLIYSIKVERENVTEKKELSSKFICLKRTIDNIFLRDVTRRNVELLFCDIQKMYRGFSRLSYLYKYKKAKIIVDYDLCLNPIAPEQKNVFVLYQNNNKYFFRIGDLISIIRNAICNTDYFFTSPLICKNPFNNVPLSKSAFYNIYFFIRFGKFILPDFIHNFFLMDFHLLNFIRNNESIIRERAIETAVNGDVLFSTYNDILDLIHYCNYFVGVKKRLKIDPTFSKQVLVNIFRPYLHLFYRTKYTNCSIVRKYSKMELVKKFKRFIEYNPTFGTKVMVKTVKIGKKGKKDRALTPRFDLRHVKFHDDMTIHDFMNSHTLIHEYYQPITSFTPLEEEQEEQEDEEQYEQDEEDEDEEHEEHEDVNIIMTSVEQAITEYVIRHPPVFLNQDTNTTNNDGIRHLNAWITRHVTQINNYSHEDDDSD